MRNFVILLILTGVFFQAQNIENQEAFKKCRKEFSKKICLSDEDQDHIPFYLDKCPQEAGSSENNGCPWPDVDSDTIPDKDDHCPTVPGPSENNGCPWTDTDGDGILDKDDACPTIPGVPEQNGCSQQLCELGKVYPPEKMEHFDVALNGNIEQIYNTINRKIVDDIMKKRSKKELMDRNTFLAIYYAQNIPEGMKDDFFDRYKEYNFLVGKFWNKDFIQYLLKKYNKTLYFSTEIPREDFDIYRKTIGDPAFSYMIRYYDQQTKRIRIPAAGKGNLYIPIRIHISFKNPYKIEVNDYANGINNKITYEYKNNTWESYPN